MAANSDKKKIWAEINHLTHIGRSAAEIERALSAMGYNESILKDILTASFMKSLVDKEEMFMEMQKSAQNRATEYVKKEEMEALRQKSQEEEAQVRKMKEGL